MERECDRWGGHRFPVAGAAGIGVLRVEPVAVKFDIVEPEPDPLRGDCICADSEPGHWDARCPLFEAPAETYGACTCRGNWCSECGPKLAKDLKLSGITDLSSRMTHILWKAPPLRIGPTIPPPRHYSPMTLVGGLIHWGRRG